MKDIIDNNELNKQTKLIVHQFFKKILLEIF